jgi:glycosyltransferase involved in cell wall biosynthesis
VEPRITVYIPSHNYGRFLSSAIDSVLNQSIDDWELIVIDDASTDNTGEIMRLYEGHPQISLFRTEGIGLPAVCNFALNKARGKYIIRLDGDDVFDENILLVLGNYLDKNEDVALVFPDYFLVDDFGKIFSHERRKRIYKDNNMMDAPPNGACTLIRREILEKLGGYREDLGAQDGFDLWTRIRDEYRTDNINLPLFYYRRHGANLTTNTNRILSARRQIKKDAIREKLRNSYPVTAIIPCRKNFDFIPDLWNAKIDGRSLLEKDIEVCLRSELIDKVVVACDNPDAEKIVKQFGDSRVSFYLRDTKETIRTASLVPTLKKIVSPFDPEFKGVSVIRYIQTPFVTTDTLDEAVTSLIMNDAQSSCGVQIVHSDLFKRTRHGLEHLNDGGDLKSDFDYIYQDASTFSAIQNKNLIRGSLQGSSVVYFEVSEDEAFFIDSEKKLKISDLIVKENG